MDAFIVIIKLTVAFYVGLLRRAVGLSIRLFAAVGAAWRGLRPKKPLFPGRALILNAK